MEPAGLAHGMKSSLPAENYLTALCLIFISFLESFRTGKPHRLLPT